MQLDWKDNAMDKMRYIEIVESILLPDLENSEYKYNITGFIEYSKEELAKSEIPLTATECMRIFKDRYNAEKITCKLTYKEYLKNNEIQDLIHDLELDADKFWLLVLFTYDYCNTTFKNGVTMNLSPFEQLNGLYETINKSENVPMTLTLKVGKQKIIVDSPVALKTLADMIANYTKDVDDYYKNLQKREKAAESEELNMAPLAVFFAKIILRFFNTQQQIRGKRKRGANHSLKEMKLVSLLIYFMELSLNRKLLDIESDTLKGYLNQYKNYKYPNNISSIYPFLLI